MIIKKLVNYAPLFRVVASFSCFTDNACKVKRLTLDNVEVFVSTEACSKHSALLVESNYFLKREILTSKIHYKIVIKFYQLFYGNS